MEHLRPLLLGFIRFWMWLAIFLVEPILLPASLWKINEKILQTSFSATEKSFRESYPDYIISDFERALINALNSVLPATVLNDAHSIS